LLLNKTFHYLDKEFMNDPMDFDLQDIINELECEGGIQEFMKDDILEFQSFENDTCLDMTLHKMIEQGWSMQ